MKIQKIKIIIWIIIIFYGLFIYPYPEKFSILSNRLVSFLILLLGLSTLFMNEKSIK